LHEGDQETITPRRVNAVIVHHGDLQRTIRAVLNHWNLGVFSDVVIVANDLCGRPDALKDIPCTWLIPDRNIGFGGACQLGATARPADVYAFFNAHVTIDKTSADLCIAAFDVWDVGIASPYIYYPGSGKPIADWAFSYNLRTYSRILRLPIKVPLRDKNNKGEIIPAELLDNDWAAGAGVFCRHEVIRDVGWDGSYFLGIEDVDICMRAKKSGWRVVIVAPAIASHTGESTRTETIAAYYGPRNQLWFTRKYRDRRVQALLTVYLLLSLFRVAVADVLRGVDRLVCVPQREEFWMAGCCGRRVRRHCLGNHCGRGED